MKAISAVLLTLLMLSLLFAIQPFVNGTPTWDIQTIDASSASPIAIAIDSNDNPQAIYNNYDGYRSFGLTTYVKWDNNTWKTQPLPSDLIHLLDFVLDPDNVPHILYTTGLYYGTVKLVYAWWTMSNWTSQIVNLEGVNGGSLALGTTGNAHIAYKVNLPASERPKGVTDNISALKYTIWNGSGWINQIIDSPISYMSPIKLGLDSSNNPEVLYATYSDGFVENVKFSSWNGSAWNIRIVPFNISTFSNAVLDSKGYPHFLYRQDYPYSGSSGNSTLSYASWNGTDWNSQIVVPNQNLGGLGAGYLALDLYDYPHIDYILGHLMEKKTL